MMGNTKIKLVRKEKSSKNKENKKGKLNTDLLTIKIKNTVTGEVLLKDTVASVMFAGVIKAEENGNKFNAGMAGEFNSNSLCQSLEAVLEVTARGLRENYDCNAVDFMEILSKVITKTVDRNFPKEETLQAVLKGIADMAENHED